MTVSSPQRNSYTGKTSWYWIRAHIISLFMNDYHHIKRYIFFHQQIEARWHIYASVNWVIIRSGNGLLLTWCQAIIWTCDNKLFIEPLGTDFIEVKKKMLSIQENAVENVVCKMAAILSHPRCVKYSSAYKVLIWLEIPNQVIMPPHYWLLTKICH